MKTINILILTSLIFTACYSNTIQVKRNNEIKTIHLKSYDISKVLVMLNTNDKEEIQNLVDKYNLKIKSKLKVGYLILEDKNQNNIEKSTIEELSNEDLVKTIKPKFKTKLKAY